MEQIKYTLHMPASFIKRAKEGRPLEECLQFAQAHEDDTHYKQVTKDEWVSYMLQQHIELLRNVQEAIDCLSKFDS